MYYHFNQETGVLFCVLDEDGYKAWKQEYSEWFAKALMVDDSWDIYIKCRLCGAEVDVSDPGNYELAGDDGVFCWFCVWGDQDSYCLSSSTNLNDC